jgi:methionyl-tRNA synthetase
LAKDPARKDRLNTVLYNLADVLRTVTILISPFIPDTAVKIWGQLGIGTDFKLQTLKDAQGWGRLPVGTKVAKPEPIFPRIEDKPATAQAEVLPTAAVSAPVTAPAIAPLSTEEVTIDDFAKMDFRVAKVLACEKVKNADKLLQLTVDLGTEQRTIVSGIAKHYKPEDLVGQNVVMIVNLKPAKIRGIVSRGMVLAASCSDQLTVTTAPGMPAGSKVK